MLLQKVFQRNGYQVELGHCSAENSRIFAGTRSDRYADAVRERNGSGAGFFLITIHNRISGDARRTRQ